MSQKPRVALLIDADNVSPAAVAEVFEHWEKLGALIAVRRAYGGFETLAGMKLVLKKYVISAFVNQGKGTTDVALVVDAMDLLHRAALPETVAICSSDADFAPLAVRLREAGLRVMCFAQKEKAAEELERSYDEVIYVGSPPPAMQLQRIGPARPQAAANVPQPVRLTAHRATAVIEPSMQILANGNAPPASNAAPVAPHVSADDVAAVRRILAELPGWLPNTIKQLNQLGKPLRDSGINKGNRPLYELFQKYPAYFKVLPMTGAAKQVRLIKGA